MTKAPATRKATALCLIAILSLLAFFVLPDTARAALSNEDILDSVLDKYHDAASSWAEVIQGRATWLFLALTAISLVWTFAQLLFHRSSVAEYFGELIRFMVFTGFFLWLLRNGPKMAESIIKSFTLMGNTASKLPGVTPSKIVDMGFELFNQACAAITEKGIMSITFDDVGLVIITAIILVIMALIGVNMLLQLCASWVLAYAGIFFLGFGGSRWTSDMAVNYFKTVLGLGASLMTMVLLVGVGTSVFSDALANLSPGTGNLPEMGVLLVTAIALFMLVDKLPAMVSGIITGASIGSMGVGSFGAGAAVGAAMTAGGVAMGAASVAGRTALSAVANIGGMTSAYRAAKSSLDGGGGGNEGGGLSAAMGNRSSTAVEIGRTMARGAATVAGQGLNAMKQSFSERARNTVGGRMAEAIKPAGANDKGGE